MIASYRTYNENKLIEWLKSEKKIDIVKQHHLSGIYNNAYFHNRSDYNLIQQKLLTNDIKQKRKETLKKINHQQGNKNSQYGTCWITNGQENKKIKKEDLDNWLSNGYRKGRITSDIKVLNTQYK